MCGRFTLTADQEKLSQTFPQFKIQLPLFPRYNIAPTQEVLGIPNAGDREAMFFRWGLIPSWAKDPSMGNQMINARAESLAEKPSFKIPFRKRRCIIFADGFYEWSQTPGSKVKKPFYVRLKSGEPFAFAGLWDLWQSPEGPLIYSCTIITTAPNELLAQIHNRMPVILRSEDLDLWLEPGEKAPSQLKELLKPYSAEAMEVYPVSLLVNDPHNDVPECRLPASL